MFIVSKKTHTVIQKQYKFEWNQKLNQIILLLWYNKNNLLRYCQNLIYTTIYTILLGLLSRTKIYKHFWHNILFHHVITDYCYPETVILLLGCFLFIFHYKILKIIISIQKHYYCYTVTIHLFWFDNYHNNI